MVFLLSLLATMTLCVSLGRCEEYTQLWNDHIYRRNIFWAWAFYGVTGQFEYMDEGGGSHYYASTSCSQIELRGEEDMVLELVVSNFLYLGSIGVNGYDKFGSYQSEALTITGAGTFQTTKRYASLNLADSSSQTLIGSSGPEFDLVVRHKKGGGVAGGEPEPLSVPLMLPNIPLYVRQLLEGLREAFESRHVKAVIGIGLIMVVGGMIAKWDRTKKKLPF